MDAERLKNYFILIFNTYIWKMDILRSADCKQANFISWSEKVVSLIVF